MAHSKGAFCAVGWVLVASGCLGMPARPHTSFQATPGVMALPNLVVYQGAEGPLSYQSPAGADVGSVVGHERVRGKACQRGLSLPTFSGSGITSLSVGWGEGAYRTALDDARSKAPSASVLFDVRADLQTRIIAAVYREQCLLVDAAVATAAPAPTPTPTPEVDVSAPSSVPSP